MPAKSPPNARPPGSAAADPTVESEDSDLAAAGRELAEELGTSGADEYSSPAERRAAERTARRRQRAEDHHAPPADRGHRSTESRRAVNPAGISMLGAVPAWLIAVVAGGVLGVILGALSVGGWLIGLLVAAVTVALLGALGSHPRSTRAGTK
jgi:uncharacterized membrane protein YdbT with pleckstrin-like domain